MRVEVLQTRQPLGHKKVGDIIPHMPNNVARTLIARGIVREMPSPENRMLTAEPARQPFVRKVQK